MRLRIKFGIALLSLGFRLCAVQAQSDYRDVPAWLFAWERQFGTQPADRGGAECEDAAIEAGKLHDN